MGKAQWLFIHVYSVSQNEVQAKVSKLSEIFQWPESQLETCGEFQRYGAMQNEY